jgi:pilus assembly protein CpaB
MTSKTFFFVVLSLIFGIFAVYLAQNWLKSNASQPSSDQSASVVTMATMVPMGTIVERKHLVMSSFPDAIISKGSVKKFEDAEGKITNQKIFQGEILREEKLNKKGEGSSLASLIQPKMRAVTIRVNDIVGVAGFLLPGNRVDVINLFNQDGYKTDIVLSNVKILAIDQRASNDENKPMLVRAVTLELTLDQAEALLVAEGRGTLQLALRNPNDNEAINIAAINKPEPTSAPLVGLAPKSAPVQVSKPVEKVLYAQSPNRKEKILILKGMQEQEIKVNN